MSIPIPQQQLAITLLGTPQADLFSELVRFVAQSGCTILQSNIHHHSDCVHGTMIVGGNWNNIAKCEAGLPVFASQWEVHMHSMRTQYLAPSVGPALPYTVYVTAYNSAESVQKLMAFFSQEGLLIHKIAMDHYSAPYTQAPMLSIVMSMSMRWQHSVSELREAVLTLGDELNLDIMIEIEK